MPTPCQRRLDNDHRPSPVRLRPTTCRPTSRQLTANVTYGGIALCTACDTQRSTLGKGQTRRRLIDAHEQVQAVVFRARQHHATWAAIARVLGTTRQAAQQRFTRP
jgi:hypothetical protein